MRILGIDPGSAVTGYGFVEQQGSALRHIAHGVFRLDRKLPPAARLAELQRLLLDVLQHHEPGAAAVEQSFVRPGNPHSALALAQARGVALATLAGAGLPVGEPTPQQVKRAVTGSGAAKKPQVQQMVKRLLSLDQAPVADASDALAVAICHAHQSQGGLARLPIAPRRRPSSRARAGQRWVVRRAR